MNRESVRGRAAHISCRGPRRVGHSVPTPRSPLPLFYFLCPLMSLSYVPDNVLPCPPPPSSHALLRPPPAPPPSPSALPPYQHRCFLPLVQSAAVPVPLDDRGVSASALPRPSPPIALAPPLNTSWGCRCRQRVTELQHATADRAPRPHPTLSFSISARLPIISANINHRVLFLGRLARR